MLTSFVLSMALAAPVPAAPPTPATTGPAPRLMEIKADAGGKITVSVIRTETVKQQVVIGVAIAPGAGGAAPPAVVTREVKVPTMMQVELHPGERSQDHHRRRQED